MVSSEEEAETKAGDSVEWDVDMEIQLFYAMANHKPVGINKHFQMACIWEKLSNSITKEISTHDIWKHLENLYDMSMLEDTEPIPFPNNEISFCLPENEYGNLMKQKLKEISSGDDNEDGRDLSPKPSATRCASRGTAFKDNTPKGTRKENTSSSVATKMRKESGSSHASTDTPSIKSEKDYDRRRDSRDSNASGPRDNSTSRKSLAQKDRPSRKPAAWDTSLVDEDPGSRRGRRRTNTSTPPATVPAKRRRT